MGDRNMGFFPLFFFLFNLFIGLLWGFLSVTRLSLVAAGGRYSSMLVLLFAVASLVVEHGL